jgi:hypothetical protein
MKACLEIFLIGLLLLISGACAADEPVAMPQRASFCSLSGRYCAVSNAQDSTTIVRNQFTPKKAFAWAAKVFVADGFISDDGTVIASCYPGKNLVPDDVDLKFVVIKFFNKKGGYKAVTLGDIYKSIDELPATTSHKDWGRCKGFGDNGFGVERADGTIWETGKLFGDESLK